MAAKPGATVTSALIPTSTAALSTELLMKSPPKLATCGGVPKQLSNVEAATRKHSAGHPSSAKSEKTTLPTIVLGDFNTLSRQKCIETRDFFEKLGYTTPFPTGTATWRTTVLKMHADWIFVRGVKIERWGVARPLSVSDHWPIWVEVALA